MEAAADGRSIIPLATQKKTMSMPLCWMSKGHQDQTTTNTTTLGLKQRASTRQSLFQPMFLLVSGGHSCLQACGPS